MSDGEAKHQPSAREYLAAELRRARDRSGISGRELAHRLGISQSKVSRIESASAVPSAPEVEAWAEAVGAPDETRQLLATLAESVFTEVDTWQAVLSGRAHAQGDVRQLEARARHVRSFQHSVVPGLLQTAEYARRVFALFQPPYRENDLAAAVAARLDRQLVLFEEGREFEFIITEAALRWRPGPVQLLLAQFDRIASLATLSNVSIGIIPQSAEAVTSFVHGFTIFDGEGASVGEEDPEALVIVETIHASMKINQADGVSLYRKRWSLLTQMAVFGDEARAFLACLAASMRGDQA